MANNNFSLSESNAGEELLAEFNGYPIRADFHKGELHFAIVDVIAALETSKASDGYAANRYWNGLKVRISQREAGKKWLRDNVLRLKMAGRDGKRYQTEVASTETLLRIVQSIPSEKAEPFKQWLAKVGYERLREEQNPSLTIDRGIERYRAMGRDEAWISARI